MTSQPQSSGVRLQYFDCRSRGQALRFALVDSRVDFKDDRVPITQLAAFRRRARQREVGGPFGALPVLDWHGHVVSQTLAIASYLAAKLGYERAVRTPEQRAFFEMISSAAHLDMQVPYSQFLWLPADHPDPALRAVAASLLEALGAKVQQLEILHGATQPPGAFFGGVEPVMADYFVYESLSRAVDVFSSAFAGHLHNAPRMEALYAALGALPAIAVYVAAGGVPFQVTASPSEPILRQRLPALW